MVMHPSTSCCSPPMNLNPRAVTEWARDATASPTSSITATGNGLIASKNRIQDVSNRPHRYVGGRPGGVGTSMSAVHSGQYTISYHHLSLGGLEQGGLEQGGLEQGGLEQGAHLARDPSPDGASRHLRIKYLYLSFFGINIHLCLGTGIIGDQ